VNGSVLEILNEKQEEQLIESLPVLLWFVLNYASHDYQTQSIFNDDGMWGVGTFINNASVIISNHYPELNAAWVRSYDSFYRGASDGVIHVSGLTKDETTVFINNYTSFEKGWEAAVNLAVDHDYMDANKYERIVVDLFAHWKANHEGEFGDSGGLGFQWSTI
jgi:hypothetical protein